MTYKCLECGHIFDEGEEKVIQERYGMENPPYYTFKCCPVCGGSYKETKKCKICGSSQLPKDLHGGACLDCIYERVNDYRKCLEVSKDEKTSVKVNAFLSTLFSESEIETLLLEKLREDSNYGLVDCSEYIMGDIDWFGENL